MSDHKGVFMTPEETILEVLGNSGFYMKTDWVLRNAQLRNPKWPKIVYSVAYWNLVHDGSIKRKPLGVGPVDDGLL